MCSDTACVVDLWSDWLNQTVVSGIGCIAALQMSSLAMPVSPAPRTVRPPNAFGKDNLLYLAAIQKQHEIRDAAAPAVDACMQCGNCHTARGAPAAFSCDIVASNVEHFRPLSSDHLVTMVTGITHTLTSQLTTAATKSRFIHLTARGRDTDEDSSEDEFEKLSLDLLTSAIDNLCAIETLLVERTDRSVSAFFNAKVRVVVLYLLADSSSQMKAKLSAAQPAQPEAD